MNIDNLPKLSVRGTIAPKAMSFMDPDSFSASDLAAFLESNKEADTIVLEIFSPGGFVSEGFLMYDMLKACNKKVITIGYSVNSIAVVVFLAGDKRFVTENVSFVIHNARIDPMMLGIEPLTAEDLATLAEEAEKTDKKIIDLYCDVIGEDNRSAVLALMGAETDLGSKGAIKYKFANGLYKSDNSKDKEKKTKNLCIEECMVNHIKNQEKMTTEKVTAFESKLDRMMNAVKLLFKRGAKNDVTLEAGDKKIVVVTDSEELVGKKAVYADADGLPTEEAVPEGEHELSDGRTLVVGADGNVTEVKEAVDVEALKKEIEDKKTEITNLKKEVTDLKAAGAEALKQINAIKTEFENFKKEIPGDPEEKDKGKKKTEVDADAWKNMSPAQRLQHMSIEKHKNNK